MRGSNPPPSGPSDTVEVEAMTDGTKPTGAIRRVALVMALAGWLAMSAAPARAGDAGGKVTYNRDIRPILSDNCFYCHGPDKNHRKGKFRLDEPDVGRQEGGDRPRQARREHAGRPDLHRTTPTT